MRVLISTDGSGTSRGPGGWAAVLRFGSHVKEICGAVDEATNNTMEITAAIMGLAALKRRCDVELISDSEYLLNGITTWVPGWKANGWVNRNGDPVKNRELWETLDRYASRHNVIWTWVKGHSGHVDNERADQLAGDQRKLRKQEWDSKAEYLEAAVGA